MGSVGQHIRRIDRGDTRPPTTSLHTAPSSMLTNATSSTLLAQTSLPPVLTYATSSTLLALSALPSVAPICKTLSHQPISVCSQALKSLKNAPGPTFLEIRVSQLMSITYDMLAAAPVPACAVCWILCELACRRLNLGISSIDDSIEFLWLWCVLQTLGGARGNLHRPTKTVKQLKESFVNHIRSIE